MIKILLILELAVIKRLIFFWRTCDGRISEAERQIDKLFVHVALFQLWCIAAWPLDGLWTDERAKNSLRWQAQRHCHYVLCANRKSFRSDNSVGIGDIGTFQIDEIFNKWCVCACAFKAIHEQKRLICDYRCLQVWLNVRHGCCVFTGVGGMHISKVPVRYWAAVCRVVSFRLLCRVCRKSVMWSEKVIP